MSNERTVRLPTPDRPWVMRTYAGHTTAKASNELYRRNLEKGQTGLSVAFDLPTQTGYDPDHELARGEVGKVGVSICHAGDMATLMEGIPLGEMNTSMTINATAMWLLALYIVAAERQGVAAERLQGTTQNDIIKEFLARGTYAFPPEPSMRLTADLIAYTVEHVPKWNPINICSYHLQEAGATPIQEIAFAMSNAIAALDGVRERLARAGRTEQELIDRVFGRISFFVNAGVRFIEEHAKLRAMGQIWSELGRERYGVRDERALRFRYGVQVNSLGLTEVQPENNIQRIVLEALAVSLGRDARARAIQLPAWNEALGLPRPWDQQWSLRIQQVLAYETDLLEHDDIFEGSRVIEAGTASQAERTRRIEAGELKVVGVNCFTESAPSGLLGEGAAGAFLTVDPAVEHALAEEVRAWRAGRGKAHPSARRDPGGVRRALDQLRRAAASTDNIMGPTLALAHAGGTTGEWAGALREVFGEYRAPTGVGGGVGRRGDELAAVAARARGM